MNTLKSILLLLTILTLLTTYSCHKDPGKTIFQGYVTEFGTREPVKGARIYISCETGPLFGQSQTGLLDSLVTDDNGYFHIEYSNRDICGGVFLTAFKEGYYVNNKIFTHSGLNDLEVVLDPEAWLKLVTIPDAGMWQSLGFGGDFHPHSVESYKGTEIQIFDHPGGREIVMHWGPFSDPSINYSDSIYLSPHDTTIYTIHY